MPSPWPLDVASDVPYSFRRYETGNAHHPLIAHAAGASGSHCSRMSKVTVMFHTSKPKKTTHISDRLICTQTAV